MTKLHRILVEGCDGSGKSTLVRLIEDKLDGNTLTTHWTAPPKAMPLNAKNKYMDAVHELGLDLVEQLQNHVIFDRFHTSDLVYLPIYSGGVNNYTWEIDKCMADIGFKQVYVFAPARVIRERLAERGDWFIDIEDVEKILDRYAQVIKLQKVPTFFYYTGEMSPERRGQLNKDLFEFLEIGGESNG